jgi:septal ring factor EnvC (AmiA/AmiB activator)
MPTHRLSPWGTLGLAWLLAGCTIVQMRADNERHEQQVQTREQELQREMQTQDQLQAERQRLLDDLRSRELTLDELKVRLEQLQRLNASLLADTQEEQRRKAARAKQLNEAANQVNGVEHDPSLTPAAKAKRLEDVRNELRKTLELLANT